MHRPWVVVALLVVAPLAGCLAGETTIPAATLAQDLLSRPWLENWALKETNFTIDYDPSVPNVGAEGTLTIRNELGESRPFVLLAMERWTITSLQDESGSELDYTIEEFSASPFAMLPSPLREFGLGPSIAVNVTLTGEVAHGATRTLRIAFEGWASDEDAPASGFPTELGLSEQFGLIPYLGATTTTLHRFTLSHPEDWIVAASARVLDAQLADGRVTTTYEILSAYVYFVSVRGLEWIEEEVEGVQVKTYFTPDLRVQGRVVHDVTARALRVMPEFTGRYPYDHIWTFPHRVAQNAFSVPGMTFMGLDRYRGSVPMVPLQPGRPFPFVAGADGTERTVVHEFVHNWWGHNIGGNNTNPEAGPVDTWITEGLTVYLAESAWFIARYGEEDATSSANAKVVDQLLRKVQRRDLEEHGAAQRGGDFYEKTGLAMRGLEAYAIATGRPNLTFEALKLAQARYGVQGGGKGDIDSEDMFAIFEETFGESLRWHFDAYWLSTELPDLQVARVVAAGRNITVEVENAGDVDAAVHVRATTLSGRELGAWGFARSGETSQIQLERPPGVDDPVVRVDADWGQWIYESDETNNRWIGRA